MPRFARGGALPQVAAALLALTAAAPSAHAAGLELIGGYEGTLAQGFGFFLVSAEAEVLEPVSAVFRLRASHLHYGFEGGTGPVQVYSPGASAGLGLRWRGASWSLTGGAEYELRNETRASADGRAAALVHGAIFSADLWWELRPGLSTMLLASWSAGTRFAWGRATLQRVFVGGPPALALGLELTALGGTEILATGGGLTVELRITSWRASLSLHLGAQRQASGGPASLAPYAGLGYYQAL